MKVKRDTNTTIVSDEIAPVNMGISQRHEDQVMILNILTNTLYSDKAAAVLREYGCNAADANVDAGRGDSPIEVRLPTNLEPHVVIRDFGDGMIEKQIYEVFCQLGRSTKRQSNDVTGMLGIGSKAGFAYGDSFMVTSYAEGTKTIYNCFRDKGAPKLVKMHSEKSESPDGMEIKVPVKQHDIELFAEKAERVYKYFRVQPIIHGKKIDLTRAGAKYKGTGWRFTGDYGTSVAVMGNVGYDLSFDAMGSDSKLIESLIDTGIELDFEIGELEIASNREGLQYSDDTKKAIEARFKVMEVEVGTILTGQIAHATTLWDAHKTYGEIFERTGSANIEPLRAAVDGKVMWHRPNSEDKFTITSARMDVYDADVDEKATVYTFERSRPYLSKRMGYTETAYASEKTQLCVNDLESKKIQRLRIMGFFQSNPDIERLVIFTFDNKTAHKKHWKKYNLAGAPVINFSSIVPAISMVGALGNSAHRAKHTAQAFIFDPENVEYRNRVRSKSWTPEEIDVDEGEGVYVVIDKFKAIEPGKELMDPYTLSADVKNFMKFHLLTGPVYGFKQKWLKKNTLGAGWVKLEVAVQKQLDEWIEKKQLAQDIADYFDANDHNFVFDTDLLKHIDVASPVATYIAAYDTALSPKRSNKELLSFVNENTGAPWLKKPDLPSPTADLSTLREAALEKYPMLRLTGSFGRRELTTISDYIKLVDAAP